MKYRVIGLMSGTSMDGLDIALCHFEKKENQWSFRIDCAKTYPYSASWLDQLNNARSLSSQKLHVLDVSYGKYLADMVLVFMNEYNIQEVDMVSSHGHTVHHQPHNGITVQIGNGAKMFEVLGITVVNDFRTQDVVLKGQGAPLVPVGDQLLFNEYDACLNLGGFANISFNRSGIRKAFDISPANIVLNHFTQQINKPFDEGGLLAKSGMVNLSVLKELDDLEYYKKPLPKSLGIEWVESNIYPILNGEDSIDDSLSTMVRHIVKQISMIVKEHQLKNVLITGGGAFNTFLIDSLRAESRVELVVPDDLLVNYKEALVFAFLGVLRIRDENNILKSVTGACRDHCAGEIHL